MSYFDQLGKTAAYKNIEVKSEEVVRFDDMIYKVIHEYLFKGWLTKYEIALVCSGDSVVRNTGYTLEDFLQIGRWIVFEQIRWYKKYGDKQKYGGSLKTLVYQQLVYRFINLKKNLVAKKRGGNIHPVCYVDYEQVFVKRNYK